jgi:CheY-like chemotaxis protein
MVRHPTIIPGKYLKLTVSDTGHGMEKDVLERIFEPYFTTKEKSGGTGLGLAVVHGIVTSYGGTITAYSEPEKGSTFKVYLPVIEDEPYVVVEKAKSVSRGHERILFIDDELSIVEIGKRILESLGYKVVTSTSSIEVLELFQKNPDQFDLVITDMTMPFMTGDELATELMQIRPDIPVIMCTGYSEKITEEKALSLGIRAYLGKPLFKSEIAETVRRVLDKNHED